MLTEKEIGVVTMYNEEEKGRQKEHASEFLSRFFRRRTKRLLTNIDRLFHKIMWIEIGISCVIVLLGTIFLLWPDISVTVLSILFGILIILLGALNIYAYLKRMEIPIFRYHLIYGLLAILLGILTLINPFAFSQAITLFLGIWVIYIALNKIDLSLRLKKIEEKSWILLFVSAILEIFISILIFVNPFSNLAITQVAGSFLILVGIVNSMNAILTKNRAIDFLENL